MTKLTDILNQRFRKKDKTKMTSLAERTNEGSLTPFSGIFGMARLGEKERTAIENLLNKYVKEEVDISHDLKILIAITSEVKAITNQAAILHGERIKRAQEILKKYRDGAFTAWLMATYGNRQTPYNFLQYYEFYTMMPKTLHQQIESMPRQAVYTLASRNGDLEKKVAIVEKYRGETKEQMIALIRSHFPLSEQDRRKENVGANALSTLQNLIETFKNGSFQLSAQQKKMILEKITVFKSLIDIS